MDGDDYGPTGVTIRRGNGNDLEAIRDVALAAWSEGYDAFDETEVRRIVDDWYDPEELEAAFADAAVEFLVAEVAGSVVGFCHGGIEEEEADILRIYVHPDHQQEGVGTALHDAFADRCRDEGVARLYAFVLADNDAGCAFYENLDFRRIDTDTTEVDGDTYEETVYEQSLWPPADT